MTRDQCTGPSSTFQPQASREKAQLYCLFQGFRAPETDKDPSMYWRSKEK